MQAGRFFAISRVLTKVLFLPETVSVVECQESLVDSSSPLFSFHLPRDNSKFAPLREI